MPRYQINVYATSNEEITHSNLDLARYTAKTPEGAIQLFRIQFPNSYMYNNFENKVEAIELQEEVSNAEETLRPKA